MGKTCGICGEDCSDRPRVRDRHGRYYCKACSLHAAALGAVSADPSDATLARAAVPYELAAPEPPPEPETCPICAHQHAPGAQVCTYCGFDEAVGPASSRVYRKAARKQGQRSAEGPRCRECGYSLAGLHGPKPVCPECGTPGSLLFKDDFHAELEREVIRREWTKPAVWLAVGLTGMLAASAIRAGPLGLAVYPVALVVQVLVGYGVLWACFTFLGDLGTPLLNLLRLAGIYALVDLIAAVAGLLPVVILPWAISLACYVGLFSDAFDTDWSESLLVIILTGAVKIGAIVAIIAVLMSL
ncbi:MAG TPA: hypothetical protein VFF69_06360 [Phycisphaerales bacterium]|nr:hypothetical protein [Phycisphaerales bacterium]